MSSGLPKMSAEERMAACMNNLPHVLAANVCPGYSNRRMVSESNRMYQKPPPPPPGKEYNLRQDELKTYVEKALQLHDGA